jgi:signal transduction histidine kinase
VAVSVVVVNGQCEIVVADDGRGMDPATLRRAFDPFFSGREAGRGVGLGLSKAWRFLHANGGDILIESRSGLGTRARITLPLVPPREAPGNAGGGKVTAFDADLPSAPLRGVKVDAASPR